MYFDKEKEKYDTDHSLWLKFSLTVSTVINFDLLHIPKSTN